MKKKICMAIAACLAIAMAASAEERTVTSPEFEMGNMTLRIGAVHLSDTATRVDAEIYQRPGWWVRVDSGVSLESRVTPRAYPMRRVEGMALGHKVFAGDSARIRATFVFDALAPEDSIFDFTEADGSWSVTGIRLNRRPARVRTRISGTLPGKPSHSWALLSPRGKDNRTNKCEIVPINDGRFEYDLYTADTLAYEISSGMEVMDGAWTNYTFFAEGVPVSIDMGCDPGQKWDCIQGGPLTDRLVACYEKASRIYKESGVIEEGRRLDSLKLFYKPEVYALMDTINAMEIGTARRDSLFNIFMAMQSDDSSLSPEGLAYKAMRDTAINQVAMAGVDFMNNDRTLAGLSYINDQVYYKTENMDSAVAIFHRLYADRFPDHPYTLLLNQVLAGEEMEKGSHYPDFTAPDLEGNEHKLSDLIAGKFAVIDLWASWCTPCRRHSIELIPVYEKWKDKGFTVVGIARENRNTRAMEHCIEQDGYPWINLVELNDARNIWAKYMIANGGGRTVLVSPNGIIIAIDPSAAEVEEVLQMILGDE